MRTDPVPVNVDTAKEGLKCGEGMGSRGSMDYHVVKETESTARIPSPAGLACC